MMDEASKRSLHDLLPGLENQGPQDPPPILDTDIELLLATQDGRGDKAFGCEHSEFIPKERTGPSRLVVAGLSLPWFPAARVLAWLWVPNHRLITDHSRVAEPTGTPNSHPTEPSHIVFLTGSAGSGKRELLEQAYRLLPVGREDGPPEGWMPPVDIIIVPDTHGLSLRLLWTPGTFATPFSLDVPCDNEDFMGSVTLSLQTTGISVPRLDYLLEG
ncbi:hypothetical protein FA13DRAFT_490452 [Coprinellus micaceus]|uniref:Uncharacterized protein n=1 Tax=Coprinellus micaceus TaxID=71717 RepID=A0A4Y7SC57_COPMI|nr:hypothetical protein FA13DRAFT_490452 [Coprinellus micaceus]